MVFERLFSFLNLNIDSNEWNIVERLNGCTVPTFSDQIRFMFSALKNLSFEYFSLDFDRIRWINCRLSSMKRNKNVSARRKFSALKAATRGHRMESINCIQTVHIR